MQIHELTRKQLNEVDIAGPDGLIAGAKAAYGALKQKGGAKDALRTVTPGQSQGAFSTADLVQSDFAKRMQAVKNNAAMKQVAANIQQQWEQTRKTLPAAQSAPATAPTKAATLPATTAPANQSPEEIRKAKQAAAAKVAQGQIAGQPAAVTTPPATTTPVQTSTTSAPGYSSVKTNAPPGIPSVGGSKLPQPTVATSPALNKSRNELALLKKATASLQGGPALSPQELQKVNASRVSQGQPPIPTPKNEPIVVGKDKPLDPKNPADAALIAKIQAAQQKAAPVVTQESLQLVEAASLPQVTKWFTQAVIPQSMVANKEKYLKNPTIQATLKSIVTAENQPDDKKRQELQAAEFLNLVSAAGVVSQQIAAKQPQTATATSGTGATAPQAAGVQAATTQLQKLAGLNTTQIEAIKKIFAGAPTVTTGDPNTANFLQAFGIKTS
jgi:hypothetical protein